MLTIAWRGIRYYPVRFLMSLVAVVLGISFVSGTFALRTALSDSFHDIVSTQYTADAYVRGPASEGGSSTTSIGSGTERASIPASLAGRIEKIPGVAWAQPALEGTGTLVGADGTAMRTTGAPTLFLNVSNHDVESGGAFSLARGRLPRDASEVVLEGSALQKSGLSVGDTTTVVMGRERPRTVRVVGELHSTSPMLGALIVGVDRATATRLFAPDGKVTSISVKADGSGSELDFTRSLAAGLGGGSTALEDGHGYRSGDVADAGGAKLDVFTRTAMAEETNEQIDQQVGFIGTFVLVFAVLALVIGAFIIANTFALLVRQRQRELAVLRAIGASPGQVFRQVVAQAAIVGVLGSALGIAGGMGLVDLIQSLLARAGMEMSPAPLTAQAVVASFVLGIGVSVLAVAVPARRAARIPPVAAMRDDPPPERSLRLRGILGAALTAAGVALVAFAVRQGDDGRELLAAGAGAALVGLLVVAPLLAPFAARVLGWPAARLVRPLGDMAEGNVARNPRRTASTAGALMIGMTLVAATAVLASSTQASVAAITGQSLTADFVLQGDRTSGQGMPAAAVRAVEDLPEVGSADTTFYGAATVDGESLGIAAVSPGTFADSIAMPTLEGDVAGVDRGEAVVQKTAAEDRDWHVGDTLTVRSATPGADGSTAQVHARIGAIVDDTSWLGVPVTVGQRQFERVVPESGRMSVSLLVSRAPGVSTDELRSALVSAVKPYYVVSVMDKDEFTSQTASQVQSMLATLYALLGLSIAIAVLGIVNTLALSVAERTREIGLLRAVGLGRLQLSTTIGLESVLISLFGALLGVGLGVGLGAALPSVFSSTGLTSLSIPWPELVGMLGLAVAAGLVAAVGPAIRASRIPVLTAIASE